MKGSVYTKSLITICVGGLLMVCVAFLYRYGLNIHLPSISLPSKKKPAYEGHVKCSLVSNIGQGTIVKIEMLIPFQNESQQIDLKNNMKILQSDFLTNIDQEKMAQWVKQRDFSALKNEFLKIINQRTKQPVTHLYFDSFNCY